MSWIVRACQDYGFQPDTGGLGVQYFDCLMRSARRTPGTIQLTFKQLIVKVGGPAVSDSTRVKESQICELMCICCIAIAAKKLEPKEKAPYLGDFEENFGFKELQSMERLVLGKLQWRLGFSSPYDFVHFWLPQKKAFECNKAEMLALCNTSIATCIKEEAFAAIPARVFGAAATLWAHHAMRIDSADWETRLLASGKFSEEELGVACECMGDLLEADYPHAFKPHRSGSPSGVMDVANVLGFSDDLENTQAGALKRPLPERFSCNEGPEVKKAKAC